MRTPATLTAATLGLALLLTGCSGQEPKVVDGADLGLTTASPTSGGPGVPHDVDTDKDQGRKDNKDNKGSKGNGGAGKEEPPTAGPDYTGGPLTAAYLPGWTQVEAPAAGKALFDLCNKSVGVTEGQKNAQTTRFTHPSGVELTVRVASYAPGGVEKALNAFASAVGACSPDPEAEVYQVVSTLDSTLQDAVGAAATEYTAQGVEGLSRAYWVVGSGNTTVEVAATGYFIAEADEQPLHTFMAAARDVAVRHAVGKPARLTVEPHAVPEPVQIDEPEDVDDEYDYSW
jgi:hypothetical protein